MTLPVPGRRLVEARARARPSSARPADETRPAARRAHVDAGARAAETAQLVDPHRFADAFERERTEVAQLEVVGHQRRGGLRHAGAVRRGELLDALREPDGVALRGIVHAQIVADPSRPPLRRSSVPCAPRARCRGCAGARGEVAQALAQEQGGVTGPLGVILERQRRAEQRHHAVAGVLVHRPLEAVHALGEQVEEAVEQPRATPRRRCCSASGMESWMSANSTVTCLRSPSSAARAVRMRSAR